ncbi:MAG: hypothetical protein ACREC6_02735 [Hyphomicrobiaceae bacterium]
MVALQVAALQQQLMVAALTCDDVSLYNSFVTTYQQDLVASDEALQAFFGRFGEEDGASAYHSFKTKMANMYSQRSATDKRRFCESARASFSPALKTEKVNLASFALSQPSFVSEPYTNCGTSVAGGAMVARAPVPAAPTADMPTAENEAAGDRPLSAALTAGAGAGAAPAAATAAGSAAVAAAGANSQTPSNSQVPSTSQAVPPNNNPQRDATRPAQNRYGYPGQGSASQAYRERLAQQQRAAQQRAAQQRAAQAARSRYPYDGRGYFWPADRYWQYCYTRYGERLPCAEAAQRFRSNQFYYRAPYDPWGYSWGR